MYRYVRNDPIGSLDPVGLKNCGCPHFKSQWQDPEEAVVSEEKSKIKKWIGKKLAGIILVIGSGGRAGCVAAWERCRTECAITYADDYYDDCLPICLTDCNNHLISCLHD